MYHILSNLSISDLLPYHQIRCIQIAHGKMHMLTLVRRQPMIIRNAWAKLIYLSHRALERAVEWHIRTRQLDALSRLDDRLLADIGLTREDQKVAYSKLFFWIP
jgi:uncharacterized protein YjiS (DUF1127 family)